jgi:prolipoprotein diacylglyceryl transferase
MEVTIGGVTLHAYGAVVGLAVVVGVECWWRAWGLLAHRFKGEVPPVNSRLHLLVWGVLVCSLIGARVWHLITDWQLYVGGPWWQLFVLWQGGLSIWGALLGGSVGAYVFSFWKKPSTDISWPGLFSLTALSVPVAQYIGRLANALNGELYGLPSDLPWALSVPYGQRLPGFEHAGTYHPLFAYEMVLLSIWLGGAWWMVWNSSHTWRANWLLSGRLGWAYLAYYGVARLGLDMIRLPAAPAVFGPLSMNQLLALLCVGLGMGKCWKVLNTKLKIGLLVGVGVWLAAVWYVWGWQQLLTLSQLQSPSWDGQQITLHTKDQSYTVELATTPESLTQGLSGRDSIGADGLLFIMPSAQVASFWMKEMRFPIDIIWINQGKIVGFATDTPPPLPGTPLTSLPTYSSKVPVEMVLEVPAGTAAEKGWQIGQPLVLKRMKRF